MKYPFPRGTEAVGIIENYVGNEKNLKDAQTGDCERIAAIVQFGLVLPVPAAGLTCLEQTIDRVISSSGPRRDQNPGPRIYRFSA